MTPLDLSMSTLSINSDTSSGSSAEDWDRSLILSDLDSDLSSSSTSPSSCASASTSTSATTSTSASSTTSFFDENGDVPRGYQHHTPRNSVAFPGDEQVTPGRRLGPEGAGYGSRGQGKRSLSELLRLHAEKGTDCVFSPEEASRVADVLGQWINAGSSPYEAEDDFFSRAMDDSSIRPTRRGVGIVLGEMGRPRGQSASAGSRPGSAAGFALSQ